MCFFPALYFQFVWQCWTTCLLCHVSPVKFVWLCLLKPLKNLWPKFHKSISRNMDVASACTNSKSTWFQLKSNVPSIMPFPLCYEWCKPVKLTNQFVRHYAIVIAWFIDKNFTHLKTALTLNGSETKEKFTYSTTTSPTASGVFSFTWYPRQSLHLLLTEQQHRNIPENDYGSSEPNLAKMHSSFQRTTLGFLATQAMSWIKHTQRWCKCVDKLELKSNIPTLWKRMCRDTRPPTK